MEFVKRCKVWKLKGDVTTSIFRERVQAKAALVVDGDVESVWKNFKECLIEEDVEVCGETQGNTRHKEWDEEGWKPWQRKSYICLRCWQVGRWQR